MALLLTGFFIVVMLYLNFCEMSVGFKNGI